MGGLAPLTPDSRLTEISNDEAAVRTALERASLPITQGWLLPFSPQAAVADLGSLNVEPVGLEGLRKVPPATPRHVSLVTVIARRYRAVREAADRADKEAIRAAQGRQ